MALELERIRTTADRVAASHGLDVVEIEFQGAGKFRELVVFVEKNAAGRAAMKAALEAEVAANPEAKRDDIPSGLRGSLEQLSFVTHEDCAAFSTDFGTVLDVEDLVPGAEYTLEVSSPGLDRKLYSAADYERFKGSLVKIQTFEPVAGNRHFQGRVTGMSDGKVTIDTSAVKAKGESKKKPVEQAVALALVNIEKANLVPEI